MEELIHEVGFSPETRGRGTLVRFIGDKKKGIIVLTKYVIL